MKNRLFVVIGILVAVLGMSAMLFRVTNKPIQQSSQTPSHEKKYCSSDSTLVSTMPIQSHRSYCVKISSDVSGIQPNTPVTLSYSIVDDQGSVVKDFITVHEKIMHFIVIRKDLTNFQHLHPEFNPSTGEFTLANFIFPTDGPYRIFADFTPKNAQKDSFGNVVGVTLSQDITAGTLQNYRELAITDFASKKFFDGYEVTLTSDITPLHTNQMIHLEYSLKKDGNVVKDLEPYLGALGHSVILHEQDLNFVHAHPMERPNEVQTGKLEFMLTFPEPGNYKIFTQFQREGKVFTTEFAAKVSTGTTSSSEEMDVPETDHPIHE